MTQSGLKEEHCDEIFKTLKWILAMIPILLKPQNDGGMLELRKLLMK